MKPEPDSIADFQQEMTDIAVDIGRDFGLVLDFTPESIKLVEQILAQVHEHYMEDPDASGLNGLAIEFGAYIVTTIQKTTGEGRWEMSHPQFGPGSFPFYWNNSIAFPVGWCTKRIFDGPADNVWAKYDQLIIKARRG